MKIERFAVELEKVNQQRAFHLSMVPSAECSLCRDKRACVWKRSNGRSVMPENYGEKRGVIEYEMRCASFKEILLRSRWPALA